MRRLLVLLLCVSGLLIVGCGGASHNASSRRCDYKDYSMGCAEITTSPGFTGPLKGVYGYGVDFGWGGPSVGFMLSHGYSFAASYLSYDFSKNWHVNQVREYERANIKIAVVWETTITRPLEGYWAGRFDASQAAAEARNLGQQAGRPIYFAVDFETNYSPWAIDPYFQGVRSILGSRTGAYGGLSTVRELFNKGLINYGWQTSAWSGGVFDSRAQLQQYGYGSTLDYDRATKNDYGQWPYKTPSPPPKPPNHHELEAKIRVLHADLERRRCKVPPYGRGKYHRICAYWKHKGDEYHHKLGR